LLAIFLRNLRDINKWKMIHTPHQVTRNKSKDERTTEQSGITESVLFQPPGKAVASGLLPIQVLD